MERKERKTYLTIQKWQIADASVTVADQSYRGQVLTPTPTVRFNGTSLIKDTDYTVTYSNNINAGTATVQITGKGIYQGIVRKTFRINLALISDAVVIGISQKIWTGKALTQNIAVIVNNFLLTAGDYVLSYSANVDPGIASVVLTGKGNYTGTKKRNLRFC